LQNDRLEVVAVVAHAVRDPVLHRLGAGDLQRLLRGVEGVDPLRDAAGQDVALERSRAAADAQRHREAPGVVALEPVQRPAADHPVHVQPDRLVGEPAVVRRCDDFAVPEMGGVTGHSGAMVTAGAPG
jgi:hypothetical protein